jgi:drug/metabolite transporter (DMT)-like permease
MLGMPACFIAAVARMPAGAVWRIFWVSPVLVAVLSWGWLRERVRAHHWLAVGVGLAGSLLLSNAGEDVVRREVILPLGMAACFSVYQVMTRAMREETAMANLFYTALFVLLPLTLGLPGFWRALTREAAAWMGAIGLVGLLGLLALERALHLAPASVVAPFVYLQPVWMAFLGGLLLGRHVERRQVAGACAVLGSGVYAILRERQIRLRQVWPGAEHGWPAAGTAPRRPDAGLPR